MRIALDPAYKGLTPSHWAYELLNAVIDGDAEFVKLMTTSAAKKWDPRLLMEPLGPEGQNILHVSALMNRPDIMETLLNSAEDTIRDASSEQRLSVRHESVVNKTTEDAHTRIVKLAQELDCIERVSVFINHVFFPQT